MSSKSDITTKNVRKPKFPELPPKYSSSRELRNKAEKMRRDRLNGLMEEMRTLVPIICNKKTKTDKTRVNILRLAASYLRVSQLFPGDTTDQLLSQSNPLDDEGVSHLEAIDGFFFMLSEDGKILFISENIDRYIGYSQMDLVGLSITDILHQADVNKFRSNISSRSGSSSTSTSVSSSPSHAIAYSPASSCDDNIASPGPGSFSQSSQDAKGPRRSFYIRVKEKPLSRGDRAQYQHMHLVGHNSRRSNMAVFVGVMRPVRDRPITELSLIEAIQDQYLTRHLPDGRIIYTDHRISTVSGYIPSEVQGKSAFNFFYAEDLPWTTMALRHMFASSSGEGTTVYRLFSSTGELICLQTRGFLEYNKAKNKIESFLCINTLIKPEDQDRYLQEQKDKFTPYISELQMDADIKQEPRAKENRTASTSTSTSAKVSVISKVGPRPGGGCAAPRGHEQSGSITSLLNTESMEEAVQRQLMGKRARLEDWGESVAKKPQYESVREAPFHRVEDGVRIIDVDNIAIEDFNARDNNETSFMNFEELISQFDYNNGAPNITETDNSNINQRSVIQKISSCHHQVKVKADYPMGDQMSSLAAPMMHCNTAQFSGAMEVGTHGLGDDTGLDCFTAMSPDLADLELSRMVAVTTSQSLTPDMSSRRIFTAEDG